MLTLGNQVMGMDDCVLSKDKKNKNKSTIKQAHNDT
jgi:hypothetical protein